MSRYTFWFGPYDSEWTANSISSLKNNEWKGPLYFDGKFWSDERRRNAAADMLETLAENKSVTSLVMSNANMDQRILNAFAASLHKNVRLEHVSLRRMSYNNEPFALPESIFANKPFLKDLLIESCNLDAQSCVGLGKLIRESSSLKNLCLSDIAIDQGAFPALAAALRSCVSLERLQMKNIHLNEENIGLLLNAVAVNSSVISLALENMHLRANAATQLAAVISQNKNLKELSLRKNDLGEDSVKVITEKGLTKNRTLMKLFLSSNPIGDESTRFIVTALQQNSSLKELCLCFSKIGQSGCRNLAQSLSSFAGLEVLRLDGNDFEECGTDFVEGLHRNMKLVQLVERPTRWMRESDTLQAAAWREALFYLRFNKGKRRVLSVQHALPCSVLPVVLADSNADADALFSFLRGMPDIMSTKKAPVASIKEQSSTFLTELPHELVDNKDFSMKNFPVNATGTISLTSLLAFDLTRRNKA